jgi:tripartite-type tricarboxylate transporter receptor subunit TctC
MKLISITKTALAALAFVTTSAMAQYTMIVPQPPGSGTSIWATIIAKGLEKHLNEKIVIRHIPGAKDIP